MVIGSKYRIVNSNNRHHGKVGRLYKIKSNAELTDPDNGGSYYKYWLEFDVMPEGAVGYGFDEEDLAPL